jgi:hypothetical protein
MHTATAQSLVTTGDLAKRHGVDRDRIDYVVKTRRIEPAAMAGHFRLFDEPAQSVIANELAAIRDKRSGGRSCN